MTAYESGGIRSFSGSHSFNPGHLFEAVGDSGNVRSKILLALIRQKRCPRCGEGLGEEIPAGSRTTACRCIPICSLCGEHEALSMHEPLVAARWPLDALEVRSAVTHDRAQSQVVTMPVDQLLATAELRPHPGGWADPDNMTKPIDLFNDIPPYAVIYHDHEPIDRLSAICNATPMHVFFSQEVRPRMHNWSVEVVYDDPTQLASGTTHSSAQAQNQLDSHMAELTISLIRLRDRVVEREAALGRQVRPALGEAHFGGYWDEKVRGIGLLEDVSSCSTPSRTMQSASRKSGELPNTGELFVS